jgi:hypothetical protein
MLHSPAKCCLFPQILLSYLNVAYNCCKNGHILVVLLLNVALHRECVILGQIQLAWKATVDVELCKKMQLLKTLLLQLGCHVAKVVARVIFVMLNKLHRKFLWECFGGC